MTLAEQLHHPATAKLVLLTCGNLGCSHAANVAVYEALRSGVATSASLMVPCPWSREAAANYRGEDLGVELTLNAPYDTYRWGAADLCPVTAGRRWRVPAHAARPLGSCRYRRGVPGMPGAARASRAVGL